jgi:glycosyltransferase involved in cell wall biosynthesis
MKFLLVSPFTSTSGSAIRFWNIAVQLHRRGHQVVYVERSRPGEKPFMQDPGVRYHSCRTHGNLYVDILLSTVFNTAILLGNLDSAIYYALKPAPNNCFPALLAKILGKRLLLDIDDLDYGYFGPGVRRTVSRFFFHFFPRFFETVTCHTQKLLEYIVDEIRIPRNRVYYLAQGVSEEFAGLDIYNASQRIPRSVIYVATLGISSDFGDMVPALHAICRRHPDVRITVVGDGVRRAEFERLVQASDMKKSVVFTGRVEHKDLPGLMLRHWVGLNYMRPSLTNECRAILKLREYLACGLHVVCNAIGDAPLFAEHICVAGDVEALGERAGETLAQDLRPNSEGKRFVLENLQWTPIVAALLQRLHIA